MGFRSGAYATLWETRVDEREIMSARLSISRKKDDAYVTDWQGWVTVYGDAARVIGSLPERARIKLGDVDVSNRYNKENGVTYTNYKVFSCEDAANGNNAPRSVPKATNRPSVADDPDAMPF